jgi:hypothetical protein
MRQTVEITVVPSRGTQSFHRRTVEAGTREQAIQKASALICHELKRINSNEVEQEVERKPYYAEGQIHPPAPR